MSSRKNGSNLKRVFIIAGAVVVALIILVVLKSPTTPNTNTGDVLAPKSLITKLASISSKILDEVGAGSSTSKPQAISGKPYYTSSGKPIILYMGAEYCPYCAAERWAMIVSLSKFGTFSNISETESSSSDVYPNTQTFSFHGSTYVSQFLDFQPVEMYTNVPTSTGYTTLDKPTSEQTSLMSTYDAPPYISSSNAGAIPFIYFAGKYLVLGATYSPQVLQGKSYDQIVSALSTPSSAISQGMLGAANGITAAICKITGNQPSTACTPTIQQLEASL